MNKDLVLIDC